MYFRILSFCELDKLPEVDEDYLLIQWKGHHFSVSIPAMQSKRYWFINKTSTVIRPWQTNCDKKCEDVLATIILNSQFMFDTFDIQCRPAISTTKYYFNAYNGPKNYVYGLCLTKNAQSYIWADIQPYLHEHHILCICFDTYVYTCTAKSLAYYTGRS